MQTSHSREDFLISPESGELKESDNNERNSQFSAYEDNDDSGSDDTSDAFEDSNETVNDIDYEDLPDSLKSKE